MDITKLIRPNIRDLTPYSSARSEFKGKAEVFLDANENPFDSKLSFNRYPDPLQLQLKKLISKIKGVKEDSIFIGNGSDEIIDIIIRVMCEPGQDEILTFTPGFGMYRVAAAINNVHCKIIELDKDYQLNISTLQREMSPYVKVIFLCSPNNPTGNSITVELVEDLCNHTDALIVIDEAYIDYSTRDSMVKLLGKYNNLLVLQTLSKAYGGAGLRIGMAFGSEELVHYFSKVKMPYNVSGANQQLAIELLSDYDAHKKMLREILQEKNRMWNKLNSYQRISKVYPSDANFYLIKMNDAASVYKTLCDKGIIIRNVSSKKGCEDCLRITVGTSDQNDRLYEVLDQILN